MHLQVQHSRTIFVWVCKGMEKQQLKLVKTNTDKNPIDMMTKDASSNNLEVYRDLVGMDLK